MSFNRPSSFRQLFFTAVTATGMMVALLAPSALGADSVTQNNGVVTAGQIMSVRNGNAMVKFGAGEIGIPLNRIASVSMDAPSAVQRGLDLQEAGKPADSLTLLKPVADTYGGLPTEWAQKSTAAIGDLYLSLDKTTEAAAAYQKFKGLYPGAGLSVQADVGMARVDAAAGKTEEAKKALAPIVANALTKPDVTKTESAAFGQAYYTLGTIDEKDGKLSEALQNYLRTVTIFYADRALTARAQEKADALRKKNPGIAVP